TAKFDATGAAHNVVNITTGKTNVGSIFFNAGAYTLNVGGTSTSITSNLNFNSSDDCTVNIGCGTTVKNTNFTGSSLSTINLSANFSGGNIKSATPVQPQINF